MFKQLFGNSDWIGKLVQLVIICFLFMMIGSFFWFVIFGNSTNIMSLKVLQLINAVFAFILPVVFLSRYWYVKPVSALSINTIPSGTLIFFVFLLIIFIQPFINLTAFLNEQVHLPSALTGVEIIFKNYDAQAEKLTSEFLVAKNISGYLFNLFLIAFIPAFSEELIFRGALQNIISEKFSKHTAVWVSAILFSLIHFQMYGFIPRMLLGVVLGYLLVWSKSLWLPVLAHFINNAIGVTISYLEPKNKYFQTFEELGKGNTFAYGIVSGIISIVILWIIYKNSKIKISR